MSSKKKSFNVLDLNNLDLKILDTIDNIKNLRKLEKNLHSIITNNKEFFLLGYLDEISNYFTRDEYLVYKEALYRIKIKNLIERLETLEKIKILESYFNFIKNYKMP
jgi:hypothetical protein